MKRVYMYTVEERVWHWIQAMIMIALMATGSVIHLPEVWRFLSFETARLLHEWLGILLTVNAAFGLVYHLFSHQIGQFLPSVKRTWMGMGIDQIRYYAWGIFRGAPHPMEKSVDHKLNPLQQVTYLGILNLLLPLQLTTGMAILAGRQWPEVVVRMGELGLLAPLHVIGAWLFTAFLIAHVYLTTTGHTLTSNVVAMVTGYEHVEEAHHD